MDYGYFPSEDDIAVLLEAARRGFHKTLEGDFVKLGTPECGADLQRRINDMSHHRNDADYGSDARSYASGMLRVYRRKLRENEKIMASESQISNPNPNNENDDTALIESKKMASRLLKLAGVE